MMQPPPPHTHTHSRGWRSQGDAVDPTLRREEQRLWRLLVVVCCQWWVSADDQLQDVSRLHDEGHRQTTVQVPGPDVVHLTDQNRFRKPATALLKVKRSKRVWTEGGESQVAVT